MIQQAKSFKVIGRKKLQFHLDQLVLIGKAHVDGKYFWVCRMGEVDPHNYGSGVMCQAHGIGYRTQHDAEEDAVCHLQNVHRAQGGQRRPQGRGRERRERELERWAARYVRERD
jgi:DNA polymerase III epsilon subunit-like protein